MTLTTFAVCRYKTFFMHVAGENSPILFKRKTYTVRSELKFTQDFYVHSETFMMGEKSPVTFSLKVWVNFHQEHTVRKKSDFVAIFQNYYFSNMLDFLSTRGEKKYVKLLNFIEVAQKLKELQIIR